MSLLRPSDTQDDVQWRQHAADWVARFCKANRYIGGKLLADGEHWAAVMPLIHTAAIISGEIENEATYSGRWCYHGVVAAGLALHAWDGTGEPVGWHRHPATGRRLSEDGETFDQAGKLVPQGQVYVRW